MGWHYFEKVAVKMIPHADVVKMANHRKPFGYVNEDDQHIKKLR